MKKKYVIIDFNSTHEYTHHWSSVLRYLDFLGNLGIETECWLPRYASKSITYECKKVSKVFNILRSPQYSTELVEEDITSYLLAKTVQKIFYNPKNSLFFSSLRRMFVMLYIKNLIRKIQRLSKKFDLIVVFPSLDLLGFNIIDIACKRNFKLTFCVRRIGSELRNPLSTGEEFEKLKKLVDLNSNCRINLGIPTSALFHKTRAEVSKSERIFWCPLPPRLIEEKHDKKHENKRFRIGFPGAAKKSKGFEQIPKIISRMNRDNLDYEVCFQKATFMWLGYNETRSEILRSAFFTQELNATLTIKEYESFFSTYDVIYLPYNESDYENADSGILYEAADWGIPVFCNKNLGFSEEAFKFGIGFDPEEFIDFKDLVAASSSENVKLNFLRYNNERTTATRKFLNL
jgi:hypothetical protein